MALVMLISNATYGALHYNQVHCGTQRYYGRDSLHRPTSATSYILVHCGL